MAWLAEKNASRAVNGGWGDTQRAFGAFGAFGPSGLRRLVRGVIVQHNAMLCGTMRAGSAGLALSSSRHQLPAGAAACPGAPLRVPRPSPLLPPARRLVLAVHSSVLVFITSIGISNPIIIVVFNTSPPPLPLPHDHPVTGI